MKKVFLNNVFVEVDLISYHVKLVHYRSCEQFGPFSLLAYLGYFSLSMDIINTFLIFHEYAEK